MRLFTVDAFTDTPFKGNPAGVCVLGTPFEDEANYLKIAKEVNYAETAFVYPNGDNFHLRWFTPTTEVKLCGHATLATAKILFDKYNYSKETIIFDTLSGPLTVTKNNNFLEMDFPLGILESYTKNEAEVISFLPEEILKINHYNQWRIVQLKDEEAIYSFKPKFSIIESYPVTIVITALSNTAPYDFISRVFAPSFGINEDSVTGSAHCYLAAFWEPILQKNEFTALQASERTGTIQCKIVDNRVLLIGDAVIMSEISLFWKP